MSRGAATPDADDKAEAATNRLPPNVDPQVFSLLPRDIQRELLSASLPGPSVSPARHLASPQSPHSAADFRDVAAAHESDATGSQRSPRGAGERQSLPQSSDYAFPGNVDPTVFSELPPDVQRELLSDWKQQKLVVKSPACRKLGKSVKSKDKKAAGKSSQANNLFNYFKPS